MNSLNGKKILLVEDEEDISQLMKLHLLREGYNVTIIANGEEAIQVLRNGIFDLVILDWMLPGASGLDICKQYSNTVPILMVTAKTEAHEIVLGLEMGAQDFITKPFELTVFLARVRAILKRQTLQNSSSVKSGVLQMGDLKIDTSTYKTWSGDQLITLTLSEFKLLAALVNSRGRVMTREKLVSLVQGDQVNVTDRTIDTHVFGLRKKIGKNAELIESIRGIGYRIKSE